SKKISSTILFFFASLTMNGYRLVGSNTGNIIWSVAVAFTKSHVSMISSFSAGLVKHFLEPVATLYECSALAVNVNKSSDVQATEKVSTTSPSSVCSKNFAFQVLECSPVNTFVYVFG